MISSAIILILCAQFARSKEIGLQTQVFKSDTYIFEQSSTGIECEELMEATGNVTEIYAGPKDQTYNRCWNIRNPYNQRLNISIKQIDFYYRSCSWVNMVISVKETGQEFRYCYGYSYKEPLIVYSEVQIRFYADKNQLLVNGKTNIHLLYDIDTSIMGIEGAQKVYDKAVSWMKYNSSSWSWIENISKVVTSLVLSNGTQFDGKNMQEELLLKQRELRIAVTLLRDSVSNEQLSVFINSLVSSCHNPRSFYGHDLVKKLMNQVQSSKNLTHPSAYLALCNANESWPEKAVDELMKVLDSQSKYPFLRDIQSFASMAVSCKLNRSNSFNSTENAKLLSLYELNLKRFKEEQRQAGNFGNVHRTALMTQALLAGEQRYEKDWKFNKAVLYLVKEMNSSTVNFLTTYLTLPILNGKSLAHISSINCSAHPRNRDDLIAEIHDYLGPKIRVQYSLFIGDQKDVIHTISLRVPKNFTAYNVMQLAQIKDNKYRFLFEVVDDKMDIYDISGIPNDSEDAMFWLLYLGDIEGTKIPRHLITNPDKLVLNDGDHLILWYKKTEV